MDGDTSSRPASFEIKTYINGEYKCTENYNSSANDIELKVTNSANVTSIKYEVNPLDNWKVELNENEKTITFTYNFVKYTVKLAFNDNDNLYGKRPNPNQIQINATSGNENKTVKIGDKVNSNWKTEENIIVSLVYLDLELDDTKEWTFSVTPNIIDNYNVTFDTDKINKTITITFTCNLRVAKWEIDGRNTTKINGKSNNGDILQTVNIGDYIIYNKDFNKKYNITYDGVISSESNEEIVTLTESNWRIIGVDNGQLLITACSNTPDIKIMARESYDVNTNGYNNGMTVLKDIASKYKNQYATKARLINVKDINNLISYFGVNVTYGNNENKLPTPILFSTEKSGTYNCDGHTSLNCNEINQKLYNLLFPQIRYYWVDQKYTLGHKGYYSVGSIDVEQGGVTSKLNGLYATHLTNFRDTYRQGYVRPVVYLKKDIIVYGSGETTSDGFLKYNIKN